MKVKITSIQELEEISGIGAAGQPVEGAPVKNKDTQTESLLRAHIRKKIIEIRRQEQQAEQQLRVVVRKFIKEAKEVANPHPNTGINKLRDAFRKAKPTIKNLFQQLTTSQEQRESFVAHLLAAFVRLFDQLDAMNASGSAPKAAVAAAEKEAAELVAPEQGAAAEIESELKDLLEAIGVEIEDDDEDEMDIVSADEEASKPKSQVEKDVAKKKDQESERAAFAAGLEGEMTGRNQAFDAFRLTQSYFSDAYLDLADETDKQMFKDWCLYNLDLLLKSFDEEIKPDLDKPEIDSPEGV